MATISKIHAIEILDSRGNPTLQTTVVLDDTTIGVAGVPSGASVGSLEAVELRDHDEKRYKGMGVLTAIKNVETIIAPKLVGQDATAQQTIDRMMIDLDGTPNKARLGANAILSVSMAVAKAAAKSGGMALYDYLSKFRQTDTPKRIPLPLFNLVNGGLHAGMNLSFQEFMIIPASSKPFDKALEMIVGIYKTLGALLHSSNLPTLVGDEGGYAPNLSTNIEVFTLFAQAVANAGYQLGLDAFYGIDAAANSFHQKNAYIIKDKSTPLSADDLIAFYQALPKQYPLLYLEDPLGENDVDKWTALTAVISQNTLVVGDDLTVTNPFRLQMALAKKAITGIIIKPNQIGTVIEAMAVAEVAKTAGVKTIVSHRSGETVDDFIADFAVAVGADYVKFGAPARGERVAKYNRLLEIQLELTQKSLQLTPSAPVGQVPKI